MESLNSYQVIKSSLQLWTQEDLQYSRDGEVLLLSLASEKAPCFFFSADRELVGAQ